MPWVDRIFARLLGFYGTKLAQQWTGMDLQMVKAIWAEELAGYTAEEIARGIDGCRSKDWPPSLPEFLKLCRPAMSCAVLWHEAQAGAKAREAGAVGDWSAPWVFHAYREMAHEVRTGEFARHGDRWRHELEKAKAACERGELPDQIPAPSKALPAPAPLTREQAKARAAALSVALPTPQHSSREWAKRLLARVDQGEHLPIGHIRMARRALNIDSSTA